MAGTGDADGEPVTTPAAPHRASYILERGVWQVVCRVCGWRAQDPVRRQLASLFRFHQRYAAGGATAEAEAMRPDPRR